MQLDILKSLIELNTINDAYNKEIIEYLKLFLEKYNFKTKIIETDGKQALIAKSGTEQELGFVCHTDTVDANKDWTKEPMTLTQEGERLYGLGVSDMKGGIGALLSAITNCSFAKKGIALYFTYDEEIGFDGIKKIIKNETEFPKYLICAEPTDLEPTIGTKGCLELKVTFKGTETHSGTPELGVNAIYLAMDFINKIKEKMEIVQKIRNPLFEVSYTTFNVSSIKGGNAINKVPGECTITFDFRPVDRNHNEMLLTFLNELVKNYPCQMEVLNDIKAVVCEDENYINTLEQLTGKTRTALGYTTEASFLDSSVCILGPGPVTAHEADESITLESYMKTIDVYQKLIQLYTE